MMIHSTTGDTWRVEAGEWVHCQEVEGEIPPGQYELSIITSPTAENWWVIRINTITGHTWQLSAGNLEPMPYAHEQAK